MIKTGMQKKYFACFISILSIHVLAFGSVIYTDHSYPTDSLTIGDKIHLQVQLVHPSGTQIAGPEVESTFGEFVVKQWHDVTTTRTNSDSTTFIYTITTYKAGLCTIPALPFYVTADSTQDTLFSRPIPLRIASVITADTAVLRDIKPPLLAGRQSFLWLWALLATGFMAGAGAFGHYFFTRGRSTSFAPPPKPPYDEAMEALAALKEKELLNKGMIREHIFELSEILKRYMGRRYETPAAEFTTEEIIAWIADAPFSEKLKESMVWFFETSHPVKFARLIPTSDTLEALCDKAESFIRQTKPVPESAKKPQGQEAQT